jgi:hypothetical protein
VVCWADAAGVITGVAAGVVTVADGPEPVGSVVHAEAQARRITSTTKIKEYLWNLMMLNSNERFIFVAISIRLYEKKNSCFLRNSNYIVAGEKLLCQPAPIIPYVRIGICVP